MNASLYLGNGYGRDKFTFPRYEQQQVFILDVYNSAIYPNDSFAKPMIDKSVELKSHIKDDEYLKRVEE
jgi:hypothetical protein